MWQDAEYWEQEWQNERDKSLYKRRRNKIDNVQWWNQRAPGFAGSINDVNNHIFVDEILEGLHQKGFLDPEHEVLDIGSGPGNYALKIAPKVKRVVALDSSDKMLDILKERAEAMNIHNIETVCMPWEEIDLDNMSWRNRFGLVMAVKTPGISDCPSLRKMVDASHKSCFYNGFLQREDHAQKAIWSAMHKEEKLAVSSDVFYIYHILFAWGYLPDMQLRKCQRRRKIAVNDAKTELMLNMKWYPDMEGRMDEIISEYIRENSSEGIINSVLDAIEGNISWTTEQGQISFQR